MKRPAFRFRLTTLLAAVAIIAVGLGWYIDRVRRQPDFKVMHMGGSRAMAPTITREYLAVDVNAYRDARPGRWHAVVLRPREQPGLWYVADVLRVVGLPGETVSFSDGKILIDGRPVALPPILQGIRFHADVPGVESVGHPYKVPEGCYYLLGDNPEEAKDSRMQGGFPEAAIRGRVPGR